MIKRYYDWNPQARSPEKAIDVPVPPTEWMENWHGYCPDDALIAAVNTALIVGRPLLLTGEPGVGKTQLAYSVARLLGWGWGPRSEPLRFDVKSTTVARDLFYQFDHMGEFRDIQDPQRQRGEPNHYIDWNALGKAILLTHEPSVVVDLWPQGGVDGSNEEVDRFDGPRRTVVLIDEIDKAPRDVPNDLLKEIENFSFRISEVENLEVHAVTELRPLIIITSNSEKHLPDAFVRRCVYHDIQFPTDKKLREIVDRRIRDMARIGAMWPSLLTFFKTLREEDQGLRKRPGVAEFLDWLYLLAETPWSDQERLLDKKHFPLLKNSLGVMLKNREDLENAERILKDLMERAATGKTGGTVDFPA